MQLGAAAQERKIRRKKQKMDSHSPHGKGEFFCSNEGMLFPTLFQLSFLKLPKGNRAEGLLPHDCREFV
jgi:hypothetical protein